MHDSAVLECILDSLSIFGDNTKATLIQRLEQEGILLTPEGFDAQRFSVVIRELLGDASNFIFVKIIGELSKQPGWSLESLGLGGRAKYLEYPQLFRETLARIELTRK